jgi:hypothetical protein
LKSALEEKRGVLLITRKEFSWSPMAFFVTLMGYFMDDIEKWGMKSLPGPLFSVKKESKFPFCDSKWK